MGYPLIGQRIRVEIELCGSIRDLIILRSRIGLSRSRNYQCKAVYGAIKTLREEQIYTCDHFICGLKILSIHKSGHLEQKYKLQYPFVFFSMIESFHFWQNLFY